VGVELDRPNGMNDGISKGYRYFECRSRFGLLCLPKFVEMDSASSSAEPEIKSKSLFKSSLKGKPRYSKFSSYNLLYTVLRGIACGVCLGLAATWGRGG
jgi:dynactin complex subunit